MSLYAFCRECALPIDQDHRHYWAACNPDRIHWGPDGGQICSHCGITADRSASLWLHTGGALCNRVRETQLMYMAGFGPCGTAVKTLRQLGMPVIKRPLAYRDPRPFSRDSIVVTASLDGVRSHGAADALWGLKRELVALRVLRLLNKDSSWVTAHRLKPDFWNCWSAPVTYERLQLLKELGISKREITRLLDRLWFNADDPEGVEALESARILTALR